MRRLSVVTAALLVVVATGCAAAPKPVPIYTGRGGQTPSRTAGAVASGTSLAATGTAATSPSPSPSGREVPAAQLAVLTAAIQAIRDSGSAHIVIRMTSEGRVTIVAGMERWKGDFAADVELGVPVGGVPPMRTLIVGSALYTQLTGAAAKAFPTPWVMVTGIHPKDGAIVPSAGGVANVDQQLALAGSMAWRQLGREVLDGSDTTHYRSAGDLQELARGGMQALSALGAGTIISDVWLDESGRVVKLSVVTNSVDGGGLSTVLTQFGIPVDVKAPPRGQVTDITKR